MKHIFRFEFFHQSISDELVILGSLQLFGHNFECHEKTSEVLIPVKLLNLCKSAIFPVPLLQFEQCGGTDRTFKMQMQLSFGQGNDKGARSSRRHKHDFTTHLLAS